MPEKRGDSPASAARIVRQPTKNARHDAVKSQRRIPGLIVQRTPTLAADKKEPGKPKLERSNTRHHEKCTLPTEWISANQHEHSLRKRLLKKLPDPQYLIVPKIDAAKENPLCQSDVTGRYAEYSQATIDQTLDRWRNENVKEQMKCISARF